ncbi:hypothetical protein [Arcobacter sp.]|uniref:hypothetical protein n=1 Tax=Arcobacter sp. TaxID=1872629 RepID=UPI003C75359F
MNIDKYFTWINLKNINSSKFINSMYIWIFIVPIFVKIFELINKEYYSFIIFGETIPIQFNLPFSLMLFYFSAIFFAIGNIVIKIQCPLIIKENNSYNDYLESGKKLLQLKPYIDDIGFNWDKLAHEVDKKIERENRYSTSWSKTPMLDRKIDQRDKTNSDKEDPKNYFWQIYDESNLYRKKSRYSIGILYTLGFILFTVVLLQNFLTVINILTKSI